MASIQERKGSYRITVSMGRDIYGKKLRETATFTPDPALTPKRREKAVADFAADFERKVKGGAAMDGTRITLQEFVDRWLQEVAAQKLQPATAAKYRDEIDGKILPALGHLKLSELKPHNLNAFFVGLTQDGARKDGKPGGYAKGSIMKTRNVLSSILRTAAEWEVVDRNPLDRVRFKAEAAAEKVRFFTPDQAAAFLEYIEQPYTVRIGGHNRIDDTGKPYSVGDYETTLEIPEQMRVMFNLALFTGLRKGELLALEFSDIDFKNDRITVSKAAALIDGQQTVKKPKTKKSFRTVSIPHSLTVRLQRLKADRLEYRLKIGQRWKGADWIFIQEDGSMMHYGTPGLSMRNILIRYNAGGKEEEKLPMIPFHGLRHTSATLLIAEHQDIKTVSRRLGHSRTSTTLDIYAHALEESDQRAAAVLENLLEKRA